MIDSASRRFRLEPLRPTQRNRAFLEHYAFGTTAAVIVPHRSEPLVRVASPGVRLWVCVDGIVGMLASIEFAFRPIHSFWRNRDAIDARQREESGAVRSAEEEGDVEGARGQDRELARSVEARRP